jgi:hypothetical protein
MLCVIMLSVVMLSVIMLSVVMLSVVAPLAGQFFRVILTIASHATVQLSHATLNNLEGLWAYLSPFRILKTCLWGIVCSIRGA